MSVIPGNRLMRKLEALKLICAVYHPDDIFSQLIEDGALKTSEILEFIKGARREEKIEKLLTVLEQLNKDGVLQLLEYEWIVLPAHKVKLSIVTPAKLREYEA
jgi:hypothetical protein